MSDRTPTPHIDLIWDQTIKIDRWHRLWIEHLQAQIGLNPRHPANRHQTNGYPDLEHYRKAASAYRDQYGQLPAWGDRHAAAEQVTRHDLAAALEVFNSYARVDTAHLGLTSHDIVDVATQMAISESLSWVILHASDTAHALAKVMELHRNQPLVARTHGQPAQLSTYGHRIATVLSPLLDWIDRARDALDGYPMRPPHGAVGTGADLLRVLTGWTKPAQLLDGLHNCAEKHGGLIGSAADTERCGCTRKAPGRHPGATGSDSDPSAGITSPTTQVEAFKKLWKGRQPEMVCTRCGAEYYQADEHSCDPDTSVSLANGRETFEAGPEAAMAFMDVYTTQIAARLGFLETMDVTRQTYHRSYDLHIAGLLTELASIAQTWANDRRLEAFQGLGWEGSDQGQIGSSAMAHKTNPVLSERIVALTIVTRGYLMTAADLAGQEWLEGDVSGSAARRQWLPGIFRNIAEILINWADADWRWVVDGHKMAMEVDQFQLELSTGAVLQHLVERGHSRDEAHWAIREALGGVAPGHSAAKKAHFRGRLREMIGGGHGSGILLREVMDRAVRLPVGTVDQQIDRLLARAERLGQ